MRLATKLGLATLLFSAPEVAADTIPFAPGAPVLPASAAAKQRNDAVDALLGGPGAQRANPLPPGAGHELAELLREDGGAGIRLAADEPLPFLANPEPSSLLVWAAMTAGLAAAGYGYRRRQDDSRALPAT